MNYSDVELLAPAGDGESLRQAVSGGASAVYLGLKNFSARAKAANFSLEELEKAIEYAHLFGVKVYVAVNTLIKNNEMEAAVSLVKDAEMLGADAFILQDIGLFHKIRDITSVPLHASTQMGIHNSYGAKAAKRLGFDRIILSRETTLTDIRDIKDCVDIEIEAFVQGALCVAFSGNCLFSSAASGYSGNRGKCMQLCRKKYEIDIDGKRENGYFLSAKDLCRLSNLKELIDSGVTSLKIEGRMRRPEYVGESTAVYREALNALDSNKKINLDAATDRLKLVFNRGDYCEGYLRDATENVIYPYVQGHKGIKIGTVKTVYNKKATLDTEKKLSIGDGLKFIGKRGETGGCEVRNTSYITFEGNVRAGDGVYLTSDAELLERISMRNKTLPLSYTVTLKKGAFAYVSIHADNETFIYKSEIPVEQARTAPISESQIASIFEKSQTDCFTVENVQIETDKDIFLPIGKLKELRRETERYAINKIAQKHFPRKNHKKQENISIMPDIIHQNWSADCNVLIKCSSLELIKEFGSSNLIDGIIYSPKDYSDFDKLQKAFTSTDKTMFLDTPIIARGKDIDILKNISQLRYIENIVANNLYAIELFREKNILIGASMNLLNSVVALKKIAPYESDRISDGDYVTAFSQLPFMTFAHCPYKNLHGHCSADCKGFEGTLKDERGNVFELSHYRVGYCYAQLLNVRPLDIRDELKAIKHKRIVYDFRGCSVDLAESILSGYKKDAEHTHFNLNKQLK